jgi:hypothetical protein
MASESAATPWNHIVLGDGCRATLIPCGSWLTKRAADGHLSCNHSDSVECVVPNHETHTLYRVEVNKWDRAQRAIRAAVKEARNV